MVAPGGYDPQTLGGGPLILTLVPQVALRRAAERETLRGRA
ncbi:hypothetical protein ACIBCM_16195 [Streptomyces sp. NPDC051018]